MSVWMSDCGASLRQAQLPQLGGSCLQAAMADLGQLAGTRVRRPASMLPRRLSHLVCNFEYLPQVVARVQERHFSSFG